MLIRSLSLVTNYLDTLNVSLQKIKPGARLTPTQKSVLGLIIVGILITGTLNWALFERRSLKKVKSGQLHWMLCSAKIFWEELLQASTRTILSHYNITSGSLTFDDTGKKRSKKTAKISNTHKVKDKATGGYFNGQELVFMVLVTDIVTIPVGFRFFMPNPELTAWRKQNKLLKDAGTPAKKRPGKPRPDPRYPTMQALALEMCSEFTRAFPDFTVKGVLADALYGTGAFMDACAEITGKAQVVSQLRSNQQVMSRNSKVSLKSYFARQSGVKTHLMIRGGRKERVTLLSARLHVSAHGKRRFVVALKYENEEEYRYLVASDLSWRHEDIARLYTLRWLVEVFIQDWKAHGGWNKLTKHQGEEGSARGVILSLLCDQLLLLHPEQSARLKNKQPGMPAGCIIEHLKIEALVDTIQEVVAANDPLYALDKLKDALADCLVVRESKKHMSGRYLGRQEPTKSLDYHAKQLSKSDEIEKSNCIAS